MHIVARFALSSLLAMTPGIAFAQTASGPADEPPTVQLRTGAPSTAIIVEGERSIEAEQVRDAVRDIAMRGRSNMRPMTQFLAPLCLSVNGLGETFNASVAERIRANARDAKLEVARSDCRTNAMVIVVKDPDRLIERLREEQPGLFTFKTNQQIKRAQRRGDAAIFWSVSRISQSNGRPITAADGPAGAAGEAIFGNANQGVPTTNRLGTSKLKINFSVEKLYSIIVFDVEQLNNVHLDQLADYATLRLLANPQPNVELGEESRADTILTLFDSDPYAAPQRMTQMDRAFLRGLYSMRPNEPSNRLEKFVLSAYDDIRNEDCAKRQWSRACADSSTP